MLEILDIHLAETETPEMHSLYRRIMEMFDQYDVEDYNVAYEDLMISADGAFDGVSVFDNQALHRLTIQFAEQILREHHIQVLDTVTTLLPYILILEFIKAIERTEYVNECHDILAAPELDALDKFAECMALVTNVPFETSMEFLGVVEDCVIATLLNYFTQRVSLLDVTDTLDETTKAVYREVDKYARLCQGQEMRSYKYLFEDDGCIGLPFSHHFIANQDYLLGLPLEAMLYECIGFALVSENGLTNPEQEIIAVLGQYINDIDRLTVIQYTLSKILIQYRNEISSGVGIIQ